MPEENENFAPEMPEIPGVPDMPDIPANEQQDAPLDEPSTEEIEDKVEISPEALLAQDLDVFKRNKCFSCRFIANESW